MNNCYDFDSCIRPYLFKKLLLGPNRPDVVRKSIKKVHTFIHAATETQASRKLRGDQKLRNDLQDLLGVSGWTRDAVDTCGERCIHFLTRALCYVDPHHQQFRDCSIKLPEVFTIDQMIQYLKVLMHCNKNITIHRDYGTRLAECVPQGNIYLTLVVNWHLCLVSCDQNTFSF